MTKEELAPKLAEWLRASEYQDGFGGAYVSEEKDARAVIVDGWFDFEALAEKIIAEISK